MIVMKIFSIIFVTLCHALLLMTLIGAETELLMADLSSEGLTELNAEQTTFKPQYRHQDDAYVITVELSDWTYPTLTQESPIEAPKSTTEIIPAPISQEPIPPEIKPEPPIKPTPKVTKKTIQKPITSVKTVNSTHNQKSTGSGNRNAIGKGTGKNAIDGPAGFANGNSDQTILRNIQRCYPLISRRRGEQGLAIVRIHVDANGNSTKTEIIQSTNFSRLDKCAIESVKSLKVKPSTKNGSKIPSYFDQPIRFRLN